MIRCILLEHRAPFGCCTIIAEWTRRAVQIQCLKFEALTLKATLRWDALGCYCHIRCVNCSIFILFLDTTDEYLIITNFVPMSTILIVQEHKTVAIVILFVSVDALMEEPIPQKPWSWANVWIHVKHWLIWLILFILTLSSVIIHCTAVVLWSSVWSLRLNADFS
jgi:hypothetical protein